MLMVPHASYIRAVRLWIMSLLVLVVCMVFIGGVTRLTESGLSIVEWKLFSGIFPPLTETGWKHEFAAYQASPEFEQKNSDFDVAQFKRIYWLEYIHRLLGRIVGLAFVIPFGYFVVRGALPSPLVKRMAIATLLVGMQGTVGWIMVQSGLVDAPRVNPLKLALHLSLALSLFALLLWTWWQIAPRIRGFAFNVMYHNLLRATTWVLVLQIVLGALVAGNDAGLVYNTYPLMDGHLVPPAFGSALHQGGTWFSNALIVQFMHRAGALVLAVLIVASVWFGMRHSSNDIRHASLWLLTAFSLQFVLGVLTLIHAVPIALASAHQMAAMLLLSALLNMRYLAAKPQM